jgi:hypothetical protein
MMAMMTWRRFMQTWHADPIRAEAEANMRAQRTAIVR